MKREIFRLAIASGFITLLAAVGFVLHHREQARAAGIAEAKLVQIAEEQFALFKMPEGIVPVYRETQANNVCRWAQVTRIYATDMQPSEICTRISEQFASIGLKSPDGDGCKRRVYPFKRSPGDPDLPDYEFADLDAYGLSKSIVLHLTALPSHGWQTLFFLSTLAELEGVPVARKMKSHFFYISLRYKEDKSLIYKKCPHDFGADAECLRCLAANHFQWKFVH